MKLTDADRKLLDSKLEVPTGTLAHAQTPGYADSAPPSAYGDVELLGDHGIVPAKLDKPLTLTQGVDVHGQSKASLEVE